MVISRTSVIPLETSGNAIMAQLDVNVVTLVKGIGIQTFQVTETVDWHQSLKQFFINVSYHILVASLTLMALF